MDNKTFIEKMKAAAKKQLMGAYKESTSNKNEKTTPKLDALLKFDSTKKIVGEQNKETKKKLIKEKDSRLEPKVMTTAESKVSIAKKARDEAVAKVKASTAKKAQDTAKKKLTLEKEKRLEPKVMTTKESELLANTKPFSVSKEPTLFGKLNDAANKIKDKLSSAPSSGGGAMVSAKPSLDRVTETIQTGKLGVESEKKSNLSATLKDIARNISKNIDALNEQRDSVGNEPLTINKPTPSEMEMYQNGQTTTVKGTDRKFLQTGVKTSDVVPKIAETQKPLYGQRLKEVSTDTGETGLTFDKDVTGKQERMTAHSAFGDAFSDKESQKETATKLMEDTSIILNMPKDALWSLIGTIGTGKKQKYEPLAYTVDVLDKIVPGIAQKYNDALSNSPGAKFVFDTIIEIATDPFTIAPAGIFTNAIKKFGFTREAMEFIVGANKFIQPTVDELSKLGKIYAKSVGMIDSPEVIGKFVATNKGKALSRIYKDFPIVKPAAFKNAEGIVSREFIDNAGNLAEDVVGGSNLDEIVENVKTLQGKPPKVKKTTLKQPKAAKKSVEQIPTKNGIADNIASKTDAEPATQESKAAGVNEADISKPAAKKVDNGAPIVDETSVKVKTPLDNVIETAKSGSDNVNIELEKKVEREIENQAFEKAMSKMGYKTLDDLDRAKLLKPKPIKANGLSHTIMQDQRQQFDLLVEEYTKKLSKSKEIRNDIVKKYNDNLAEKERNRILEESFSKEDWEVPQSIILERGSRYRDGKDQLVLHKQKVEKALKEGKPVPADVLKEYPDLQALDNVTQTATKQAEKVTQKAAMEAPPSKLADTAEELPAKKQATVEPKPEPQKEPIVSQGAKPEKKTLTTPKKKQASNLTTKKHGSILTNKKDKYEIGDALIYKNKRYVILHINKDAGYHYVIEPKKITDIVQKDLDNSIILEHRQIDRAIDENNGIVTEIAGYTPKPDAKPKDGFIEAEYGTKTREGTRNVSGITYSGLGIANNGQQYIVTHLKSGLMIDSFGTLKEAKAFTKYLADNADSFIDDMEEYVSKVKAVRQDALDEAGKAKARKATLTSKSDEPLRSAKTPPKQESLISKADKKPTLVGKRTSPKKGEPLRKEKIDIKVDKEQSLPTKEVTKEPVSRSDIESYVERVFGVKVAHGKYPFKQKKALGVFKNKPEIIRLRDAKDIDTLMHEVGHYLDKKFGLVSSKHIGELEGLGTYSAKMPKKKKAAEDLAEFVSLYTQSADVARKKYPNFTKYFEETVVAHKEITGAFDEVRRAVRLYESQSDEFKVLSNIKKGYKPKSDMGIVEKIQKQMFDENVRLRNVVNRISGGVKLNVSDNPYDMLTLYKSWEGKASQHIYRGVMDENFNVISKSLQDVFAPVSDSLDEFRAYAISKRAVDLDKRGIETGIDIGAAKRLLVKYADNKVFETAMKELVEYQDNVLHQLVEVGILDKKGFDAMRAFGENYISLNKIMDNISRGASKKTLEPSKSILKHIHGGKADILDPFESVIRNTYMITEMAERQRVMRTLIELGNRFEGAGKIFDKVPIKVEGIDLKLEEIKNAIKASGADILEADLDTIATIFRPVDYGQGASIVKYFVKGKPEYYQVFDPELFQILKGMTPTEVNAYVKLLSAPARWLRAGATLTPEFMARNPLRDTFTAFMNSEHGFIPVVDTLRGLFHVLKRDHLYQKLMASGGLMGNLVSLDRDYLKTMLRKMLIHGAAKKTIDIATHPLDILRGLSEFMEEATRVGAGIKTMSRETLNELNKATIKNRILSYFDPERVINKYGMSTEVVRKGAKTSRGITLDFKRRGKTGKQINIVTAFFNAKLQDYAKTVETFGKHPLKTSLKGAAVLTLPTLLLYMVNRNDPRYQELPQWQKDSFFILPTKDKLIRIPKPFTYGLIFSTAVERALQYLDQNDKNIGGGMEEAFKTVRDSISNDFATSFLPTAILALVEAGADYSFFYGRAIDSISDRNLYPSERYTVYTSEAAKALSSVIAKELNISPKKIDHVLKGYFGGLGQYATQTADWLMDIFGISDADILPAKKLHEKLPVLKGFTVTPYSGSTKSVDDLYDKLNDMEMEYATQKHKGIVTELSEYEKADELRELRKAADAMSDARKERNATLNDSNLTSLGKREKLDTIDKEILNIAREVLGKPTIP